MKRLPDTEFSVMNAIWEIDGMINSTTITQKLSEDVHWKTQTLLTLLARLCEKRFLSSEKIGRDRFYKVLISKDDYLNFETEDLMKRYTGNTVTPLINRLFESTDLSEEDVAELKSVLQEK